MKYIITTIFALFSLALTAQNINITPASFNQEDEVTITLSNFDVQAEWGTTDVYLWAWYFQPGSTTAINSPVTSPGGFNNSPAAAQFTNNGDGTYSYTFTPTAFYNATDIDRIGVLAKNQEGSEQTGDFIFQVGVFGLNLISPADETSIVTPGSSINISADTGIPADFELFANGTSVDTQNGVSTYTLNRTINDETQFELRATNPSTNEVLSRSFTVLPTPNTEFAAVPANMNDGINVSADGSSVTLVLFAPDKDFVHVIGNFTDDEWALSNENLLKFDTAQNKYWITLDVDPNQDLLFQYLVDAEITIADPYSTLILSSFNDGFIPASTFPNIPAYPEDETQDAVSWVRLTAPEYTWQTNSFTKPAKEDLVIYELHVRDFDVNKNFQDIIERLDYLESLGVNAIELMPVSEFDGNLSWGYNPSFHMALDKAYGTPEKFKELVDAAHSRGIAVILDVVYNQATGQSPLYRLYNDCNGCYGGQASNTSPYFNTEAAHSFNVFNDFNHSSDATRNYVTQSLQYWIDEFRIDGMRWDLTKGFTQNCTGSDSCTNNFQQDRVDVLKFYADNQWAADDTSYVIFEHLGNGGSRQEEIEWANHRLAEGKGIMSWNKLTDQYNQNTMGYNTNNNIVGVSYQNNNFPAPRQISYMESHDEERLNYKNQAFGNSNANYDATDLTTALDRLEAAGAFFFTVPGPKMLWQFQELGYDTSIFTCPNGTLPTPYGNDQCKTDEKPDGWAFLNEPDRVDLFNTYAQMINLKKTEPIFKTTTFSLDVGNSNGLKKLQLEDTNATDSAIRYVTVIGNFGITQQNINPTFQETGTWYNMLSSDEINVSNPNQNISLQPGQFFIYSNEQVSLSVSENKFEETITIYPNPSKGSFALTRDVERLEVYNINGQRVLFKKEVSANTLLSTEGLSQGIYMIKATSNNTTYNTKLIISQ